MFSYAKFRNSDLLVALSSWGVLSWKGKVSSGMSLLPGPLFSAFSGKILLRRTVAYGVISSSSAPSEISGLRPAPGGMTKLNKNSEKLKAANPIFV